MIVSVKVICVKVCHPNCLVTTVLFQGGKFLISSGLDSYLVNILNCGATPASSRFELLIQVVFCCFRRELSFFYV